MSKAVSPFYEVLKPLRTYIIWKVWFRAMLDQEGYQHLVLVVDCVVQGTVTELSSRFQINELRAPYHIDFFIYFVSILSIKMLFHSV